MNRKNRYLAVILMVALFFSQFHARSIASPLEFSDVPPNHWAYEAITTMARAGIIVGFPDGTFRPNNLVLRSEFAKIMTIATGVPIDNNALSPFDDVPYSHWAKNWIVAARYYLTGMTIGNRHMFLPEGDTSRGDAAVACVRLQGLEGKSPDYSILQHMFKDYKDITSLGDSMTANIALAVEHNLMIGDKNGYFNPNKKLTRAEAAMLFFRLMPTEPTTPKPTHEASSLVMKMKNTEILEGDTTTLEVNIVPGEAKMPQLLWESNNKSIAYVDSQGKVTGVSEGIAAITAKSTDGKLSAVCNVYVLKNTPAAITLDKKNLVLQEGSETTLQAKLIPTTANSPALRFETSNANIVYVTNTGHLTAISAGTATVTVTVIDSGVKAVCTVTVEAKTLPTLTLYSNSSSVRLGQEVQLSWELSRVLDVYGTKVYATEEGKDYRIVLDDRKQVVGYMFTPDRAGIFDYKVSYSTAEGTIESNLVRIQVLSPEPTPTPVPTAVPTAVPTPEPLPSVAPETNKSSGGTVDKIN